MTLYYVGIFSRADFYNRAEFTDTVRGKVLEQGEQEEEIHLHKQDRAGQRVNNKYRRSTHTRTDTHTRASDVTFNYRCCDIAGAARSNSCVYQRCPYCFSFHRF